MHVHEYEKLWLALSLVLILLLIGTITYGAVGPGVAMVSDDQATIDPTALDEDDRFADPRVEQVGPDEYEVYVVARQFAFDPDPIVVPANSKVTFMITSPDVIHGFQIVGTNANTMVIPGEVAEITVRVDEPGTYGIVCNEYCGAAHHAMEGSFEVVPEDEYDADTSERVEESDLVTDDESDHGADDESDHGADDESDHGADDKSDLGGDDGSGTGADGEAPGGDTE